MAHTNKMRNYIIEKKFLLPTYLILLPNNKCIPKLQQYLPIPSHPSPRKKKFKSQKNVSYPDLCSPLISFLARPWPRIELSWGGACFGFGVGESDSAV